MIAPVGLCPGQLVEQRERGRLLGLGQHHVEGDDLGVVVIEELIEHLRNTIPRPRPLALLGEARLVDLDDDDALVDASGQRQQEAHVVGDALEAIDEGPAVPVRDVDEKERQDEETQEDPDAVAIQIFAQHPYDYSIGAWRRRMQAR